MRGRGAFGIVAACATSLREAMRLPKDRRRFVWYLTTQHSAVLAHRVRSIV